MEEFIEKHLDENGEWHNDSGPAIVNSNGTKHWYKNGNLHNEIEPAIITYGGYRAWYENGILICDRLPDGTKKWYKNGVLKKIVFHDGVEENFS